jgi:hypothetical protein
MWVFLSVSFESYLGFYGVRSRLKGLLGKVLSRVTSKKMALPYLVGVAEYSYEFKISQLL